MSLIESMRELGTNVEEGLDRVMGDASLYEMVLGMFVDSVQENPVSPEEFDGAELDDLIRKVHTLKGVTGNLAITPLMDGYTRTLSLLRAGQPGQAKAEFERLLPIQAEVIDCINRCKGTD